MAGTEGPPLAATVHANDKLLKALTILLAMKDEHLLGELRTIFAYMTQESPEMAQGSAATWEHLRHELSLIADLVEGEADDDDGEAPEGPLN